MTRPPRLARALLRLFVPADVRDSVDGDLAELHAAHANSRGRVSAAMWYWQEVLSFSARFALDRIRRSVRRLDPRRGVGRRAPGERQAGSNLSARTSASPSSCSRANPCHRRRSCSSSRSGLRDALRSTASCRARSCGRRQAYRATLLWFSYAGCRGRRSNPVVASSLLLSHVARDERAALGLLRRRGLDGEYRHR